MCECVWQELPNQAGQVKGSVLVTECEFHRTQREQANADREAAAIETAKAQETETLIQSKIRTLAIEKLKTEGKLDAAGVITADGKAEVVAINDAAKGIKEKPEPIAEPKP